MSEKSTVQLLLEARFQELAQNQEKKNEIPKELRQEVFRSLDINNTLKKETNLLMGEPGEATTDLLDAIEDMGLVPPSSIQLLPGPAET